MYVRDRAEKIRNPRTERQQANRHKLSVASRFLAQMQPMVARGFRATMTQRPGWESRRVGAYHVAMGALLKSGMRRGKDGWQIDFQHVKLSEGNSLEGFPMEIKRSGREVNISFPKGLPKGTKRVRVAIHSARKGRTAHVAFDAPRKGETVRVTIPKWAASGELHAYYTVDVKGKSRWASLYVYVPKGRGASRRSRAFTVTTLPPSQAANHDGTGKQSRSDEEGRTRGGSGSYPPGGWGADRDKGLSRKE